MNYLYDIDVNRIFHKAKAKIDDREKERFMNYTWRLWNLYILSPIEYADKLSSLHNFFETKEKSPYFDNLLTRESKKLKTKTRKKKTKIIKPTEYNYPEKESYYYPTENMEYYNNQHEKMSCYMPGEYNAPQKEMHYNPQYQYYEPQYNYYSEYDNMPVEGDMHQYYQTPENINFENIYNSPHDEIYGEMGRMLQKKKSIKTPHDNMKKGKRGRKSLVELYGEENIACAHCGTRKTTLWRRWHNDSLVCNACGLYYKLHNKARPLRLQEKHIKRRERTKNTKSNVKDERFYFY